MSGNSQAAREWHRSATLDREQPQLELWEGTSPADSWSLRESLRARRLSVRVYRSGRVEVVVPLRTSRRTLQRFLEQHRAWIERKRLAAQAAARPLEPFPPREIVLGATGERLRVHLAGGFGRLRARHGDGGVLGITGAGARRDLERVLRRWLVEQARVHLGAQLATVAAQLGFEYSNLAVRRQRTRWGSCSTRGTISLNCCLMFQRPEVVRYLLIHELAHTRHMNHSAGFWSSVAAVCPHYRSLDRELLEGWRLVPSWVFDSE